MSNQEPRYLDSGEGTVFPDDNGEGLPLQVAQRFRAPICDTCRYIGSSTGLDSRDWYLCVSQVGRTLVARGPGGVEDFWGVRDLALEREFPYNSVARRVLAHLPAHLQAHLLEDSQ